MKNMRKAAVMLLAFVMLAGLTAEGAEPNYLKIGAKLDMAMNIDPITSTYNEVFEISNAICNRLVQPDPVTMELKPVLIEDFPEVSEDGTVFTFRLKKGVKFHNGAELTARDVEYTFTRFFDPAWNNLNMWMADVILGAKEMMDGNAKTLAGFKVIDDYTFSIELTYGYTAFIAVLAVPPLAIMPKDACEAAKSRWGIDTLIGTGQYKVKSFEPGVELILERNGDYHSEPARLDGVQFNHMLSDTQLLEWEAGAIDICEVDVSLVDYYNENFPGNVRAQPYVGTHWLVFNQDLTPFNDVRVRTAVGLATDITSLCQNYFKAHVAQAKTVIPKGIPGYDDSLPFMEYNPEKAKALLAEAGYPDGIDIEITVRDNNPAWIEIYQIFQEQYKLANINLSIDRVDAAGWLDKRSSGNVQIYMMNWFADFLDPDNYLYSVYHSSVEDFFSTGNKDEEFDKKLMEGRLLSREEKQGFYSGLERYLIREKVAGWPLYTPVGHLLISDRVKDVYRKSDVQYTFEIGYLVE